MISRREGARKEVVSPSDHRRDRDRRRPRPPPRDFDHSSPRPLDARSMTRRRTQSSGDPGILDTNPLRRQLIGEESGASGRRVGGPRSRSVSRPSQRVEGRGAPRPSRSRPLIQREAAMADAHDRDGAWPGGSEGGSMKRSLLAGPGMTVGGLFGRALVGFLGLAMVVGAVAPLPDPDARTGSGPGSGRPRRTGSR